MKNNIQTTSTIQEWVTQFSDDLYRWALHKTSNKNVAEDLVQDTFLAAVKSIDGFLSKSEPKTWLFSILNNKIMDYHRKKFKEEAIHQNNPIENGDNFFNTFFDHNDRWKTSERIDDWETNDGHLLDNIEFNKVLQNCMKKLPEQWFSALQLKYLKEIDGKVICQELGITPSNFWQILHRAKLQLRGCLENNWFKI